MHKIEELTGDSARKVCARRSPFGPGVPVEDLRAIQRVEVWGSSFKDLGPDYCEFRTFDANGQQLNSYRIEGY